MSAARMSNVSARSQVDFIKTIQYEWRSRSGAIYIYISLVRVQGGTLRYPRSYGSFASATAKTDRVYHPPGTYYYASECATVYTRPLTMRPLTRVRSFVCPSQPICEPQPVGRGVKNFRRTRKIIRVHVRTRASLCVRVCNVFYARSTRSKKKPRTNDPKMSKREEKIRISRVYFSKNSPDVENDRRLWLKKKKKSKKKIFETRLSHCTVIIGARRLFDPSAATQSTGKFCHTHTIYLYFIVLYRFPYPFEIIYVCSRRCNATTRTTRRHQCCFVFAPEEKRETISRVTSFRVLRALGRD